MKEVLSRGRLVALAAVFVVALAAFLLLLAFAPASLLGEPPAGTAASRAATGFAGITRLLPPPAESDPFASEDLLVIVMPRYGLDSETLKWISEARGAKATLLVLPKWIVQPSPLKRGQVVAVGLFPPHVAQELGVEAKSEEAVTTTPLQGRELLEGLAVPAPRKGLQWLEGKKLAPLLTDSRGRAILVVLEGSNTMILSDPDLVNNLAMADPARARAAVALLEALNSTGATSVSVVDSDVLNARPNLLRTLFTPPFLAMTLVLLALLLFGLWQAVVRFGAPRLPPVAIPPGKQALVDNAAGLLRMAGREALAAPAYARLVAHQAAAAAGLPAMDDERLRAALDRIGDGRFSGLAARMEQAGRQDMLDAAQDLYAWKEGLQR